MRRHDWTTSEVQTLFELPFNDLLFKVQTIHREHFDPNKIQLSTLLSIKTFTGTRHRHLRVGS
jgi:biotin synthase